MPIITKAGSPVKGSPTQFTLDKTALAAIVADAYYADEDNWKEVVLNYKSSTGNQKEIVKFDASLASPTANFAVSLKARNIFEIHKIVIKDFDGGAFEVPRSALTTSEFDVDMSAAVSTPITYNINTAGATLNASGGVSGGTYLDDYYVKSTVNSASGDFTYEFEIDWSGSSFFNVFVGITQGGEGPIWYQGLTAIEGTTNGFYRVWQNGSPVGTSFSLSLTSHTVRLSRVGSTMNIYIDNMITPAHTFSVFTEVAVPTVRTKGLVACTSSSVL